MQPMISKAMCTLVGLSKSRTTHRSLAIAKEQTDRGAVCMVAIGVAQACKGTSVMTPQQQGREGRMIADLGGRQGPRPSPGGRHRG